MSEPSAGAVAMYQMAMAALSRSPGQLVQPMIDSRRTLVRILAVEDSPHSSGLGIHRTYVCVDQHGQVHSVWPMDDPRLATLEDLDA